MSKFTITAPRAIWLSILTAAHKITAAGKPVPVFGCVRLASTTDGRVSWAATDGDCWRLGSVPADTEGLRVSGDGAALVPVAAALPVLKSLSEGAIALEWAENGHLQIQAGKFRGQLPTFPIADFPLLPAGDLIGPATIPAAVLVRLIHHALPCVHQTSAQTWMKGIRIDRQADSISCTAADGHKLAYLREPLAIDSPDTFTGEILPWRPLADMRAMLEGADTVVYARDEFERHWFTVGADSLVLRGIQAQFPDVLRVIPARPKVTIEADRLQLLGLVRRLGLLADANRSLRLQVEHGQLVGRASSGERGQGEDAIPVSHTGPALAFAISHEYLTDLLEAYDSPSVQLEAVDELAPIAIRPTGDTPSGAVYAVALMRI